MRILVTGAAGMLGSGMVPALASAGHEVVATDIRLDAPRPWGTEMPEIRLLDVRSPEAVGEAVEALRPGIVLHLAAETSLEVCEDDPDHAWTTNAIGTKHVAIATARADVPMAYISTAGVFDGTKSEAYTEFDEPNPINVYGRSKFEGERYVRWFNPRSFIVRAGWMVGGGPKDHKFVSRIVQQVQQGAREIHAVADKFGTPTYVPDFSRCFSALIDSGSFGLYHMACEGRGSRYDVAAVILDALGVSDRVRLVEVDSMFFADEFPAPRPRSEIMRNLVLHLQGLNTMRPWQVALREYLATTDPAVLGRMTHSARIIDLTTDRRIPGPRTVAAISESVDVY